MTDKDELKKITEKNTTATEAPEMDEDFMKAAALAYAKYMDEHGKEPEPEDTADESDKTDEAEEAEAEITEVAEEAPAEEASEVEARTEEAPAEDVPAEETPEAEAHEEEAPKEAEAEEAETEQESEKDASVYKRNTKEKPIKEKPAKKKSVNTAVKRTRKKNKKKFKENFEKTTKQSSLLINLIDVHDRAQDSADMHAENVGKGFAKWTHDIAYTYRNTRRSIGWGILIVGLLAAVVLVIFDRFTVYEYAYNGKVLGYVSEQEEVTDVLDVAGKKLTQNTDTGAKVEFVANQNVTFNQVDGRGKSTDDADIAVNKLIYMTDIETEAYAVYDGNSLKAIVKDENDAETLLAQTKEELSVPDDGMTLVSSEFTNPLEIRTINVLLGSVQSNMRARRLMIDGGKMEIYHIVDSADIEVTGVDESVSEEEIQRMRIAKLAETFGVDPENIFDEDNRNVITEVEQGDIVCIRNIVEPVNVKMVETGKIREIIDFKTIKKDSDEYYQGDTYVKQKGVKGIQIFEGTLTKEAGEIVDREEISTEIIREPKDKIILIGTKERPKTAPTGTYQMPIKTYVVTSEFGGRWGRMHEGMDFGASTGTPIYAADGGTVTRATYYSGYGLCVDIDHENGRSTRYGHCSKLLVSAGDKVYQGQEIALVGNTGHSFGSHLHFEVRINGAAQNPRNYVDP